MKDMQAWF